MSGGLQHVGKVDGQPNRGGVEGGMLDADIPVAYYDASNKADPTDSKCQYGYCHLWQGGPIIACSKKLAHVGLSRWRRVRQSENPLSPLETIARRSSMEFVPTAENLADLS
eukprot:TRINITY_DN890_c0_g1_i8.p5 TRINITY_DN890_c0_g1~~TRINITY_DN890_c0_g1_i8.p5  ORF type:complete len:111 (+),score=8.71 TRINITY_DN890_c0_g1_i8:834-1166(+)